VSAHVAMVLAERHIEIEARSNVGNSLGQGRRDDGQVVQLQHVSVIARVVVERPVRFLRSEGTGRRQRALFQRQKKFRDRLMFRHLRKGLIFLFAFGSCRREGRDQTRRRRRAEHGTQDKEISPSKWTAIPPHAGRPEPVR